MTGRIGQGIQGGRRTLPLLLLVPAHSHIPPGQTAGLKGAKKEKKTGEYPGVEADVCNARLDGPL